MVSRRDHSGEEKKNKKKLKTHWFLLSPRSFGDKGSKAHVTSLQAFLQQCHYMSWHSTSDIY